MAITISEQMALNLDTSNLLITMQVLAAAGGLGGFFPPLVMGAAYDAVANSYFNGQMLLSVTAAARVGGGRSWYAAVRNRSPWWSHVRPINPYNMRVTGHM